MMTTATQPPAAMAVTRLFIPATIVFYGVAGIVQILFNIRTQLSVFGTVGKGSGIVLRDISLCLVEQRNKVDFIAHQITAFAISFATPLYAASGILSESVPVIVCCLSVLE